MAIYGQTVDQYSPAFQGAARGLQGFAQTVAGGTTSQAAARAKVLISSHIGKQAFVASVDDVFLLAAAIILFSLIPILLIRVKKKTKGQGKELRPALEE